MKKFFLILFLMFSTSAFSEEVEISFFFEGQLVTLSTTLNQSVAFSVEDSDTGFDLLLTPELDKNNNLILDISTSASPNNARLGGPNFTPTFERAEFLEKLPAINKSVSSTDTASYKRDAATAYSSVLNEISLVLTGQLSDSLDTVGVTSISDSIQGGSGSGRCCVTCGSTTACGTKVRLSCGSCEAASIDPW